MSEKKIGGEYKKAEFFLIHVLGEGAEKTEKTSDGDVVWNIGEDSIIIEVKSGKKEVKITLNQIRPYKYLPLVADVRNKPYSCDYMVYPPNYIVRYFLTRKGQSTPDGLSSSSTVPIAGDVERFGCSVDEVAERIKKAYEEGENDKVAKSIARDKKNRIEKEPYINQKKYDKIYEWDLLDLTQEETDKKIFEDIDNFY